MVEDVCPTCGKKFIAAPEHALVDKEGRKYCKPTCFLHRPQKPIRGRKPKRVFQYTLDGQIVQVYRGALYAADINGFAANQITKACREGTKYRGFLWKFEE